MNEQNTPEVVVEQPHLTDGSGKVTVFDKIFSVIGAVLRVLLVVVPTLYYILHLITAFTHGWILWAVILIVFGLAFAYKMFAHPIVMEKFPKKPRED